MKLNLFSVFVRLLLFPPSLRPSVPRPSFHVSWLLSVLHSPIELRTHTNMPPAAHTNARLVAVAHTHTYTLAKARTNCVCILK